MTTFKVSKEIIEALGTSVDRLSTVAAAHRINCLAGLRSANHGWLGACFSSMELLTCIYHKYIQNPILPMESRGSVYLSKGHAAMAQYAILAAMGCLDTEQLDTYKRLGGLPAHCDRNILGVDCDSGSYGKSLSLQISESL